MIGTLQRVPLREVWQHEAYDFTTWLERNLDALNDALDITLSGPEREQSAGAFFFAQCAFDEESAGRNRLTLASCCRIIW